MMGDIEPEPKDERRQFIRMMQEMSTVKDFLFDIVEHQKVTNVLMTRLLSKTKEMEEHLDGIDNKIDSINSKMAGNY